MTENEAEGALDPQESLRLIEQERAGVTRRLEPNPLVFYGPWGLVWLIGFGMFFLRYGVGDGPVIAMPDWLPGVVLASLIVFGIASSTFAGARTSRHVRGESSVRGMYYGISWFLAFGTMIVLLRRITVDLPPAETGLAWAAASTGIVGVLYVAGAAIWLDRTMFGLGLWVTLVNIAGIIAGIGWHALIVSLAGGGGLLVAGSVGHIRRKRRLG